MHCVIAVDVAWHISGVSKHCWFTCLFCLLHSRMEKFGIPCPSVILQKKHILVMSFIGSSQLPAPKLRDAHLSESELQCAFEQCIQVKQFYVFILLSVRFVEDYFILF